MKPQSAGQAEKRAGAMASAQKHFRPEVSGLTFCRPADWFFLFAPAIMRTCPHESSISAKTKSTKKKGAPHKENEVIEKIRRNKNDSIVTRKKLMPLPTSINSVITQLEQIVRSSEKNNTREGYFAALYLRVTKDIRDKINANYFEDNSRMERLDVIFASRYLAAYDQYLQNKLCSASWKVAFDACRQWKPLVLQHLFIGMNAHISLDLGIAAATVCPGDTIQSLHNDFNKINEVLSGLVNTVKEEITTFWPLLRPINWLAGKLEDEIATFSMDIARDAAWQEALSYAALATDEQRTSFINTRDEKVAAFGKKIDKPGAISIFIWMLRMFELGSIRKKIQILNSKAN